ncbi:hypothetical protein [Stackebrandtia soli]|uniref:hypothetical protein n=1 Tax=Stackebrandtia soli TaxID=1892856 RepID=UPI0039EC1818
MTARIATGDETTRRADYLAEVTSMLFPSGDGDTARRFIAVPNLRHARVLVPESSRRVAAAALRQYARPAARSARLKRDAAVAALVTRTDRLLLRDRLALPSSDVDIARHLTEVMGHPVHLCIHIGPARANRKPILQLLTESASSVGFVKIGVNDLTRGLVRDESRALRTLAGLGLSRVEVPGVIHTGRWRGHELLVQQALPGWERPAGLDRDRLHAAMRELAHCTGTTTTGLADSRYARRLRRRLDALGDSEDGRALVHAGRSLLDRNGRHYLTFGSWHGDWAPWNMAMLPTRLLLWDLERFATDVPVGFDPLHYALQDDIVTRRIDPAIAVASLLTRAPAVLSTFGIDPQRARLTTLLYLVDLATRYLADGQAEAGAALGALGRWLLPTLLDHIVVEGEPAP